MDQDHFKIGWKTLQATYRIRPEDERDAEYFRHLKPRLTNAQWTALCDHLAVQPQDSEEARFLPSPGDLLALSRSFRKDGQREEAKAAPAYCGRCGDGMVLFLRVVMGLDPTGQDRAAEQVYDLPPDAQRSLEWFRTLRASPVSAKFYPTSAFCDCRKAALDREKGQGERPRVFSEVTGFAPPQQGPGTNVYNLAEDLAIMVAETWPWTSKTTPERIAERRAIRDRIRGRLVYDVPLWARAFGPGGAV